MVSVLICTLMIHRYIVIAVRHTGPTAASVGMH